MDVSPWTLAAIGAAVLLLLAARTREVWVPEPSAPEPVELDDGQAEQGQGGGFDLSSFLATYDVVSYLPDMSGTTEEQGAANLAAFLATIRNAEGTAGANGYRTMFGGKLFAGYADHPRRALQFTDRKGRRLWTSAAGAYQFMAVSPIPTGGATKVDTWDRLAAKLGLPDFSPESQDVAAVELIREGGALDLVRAGRFDEAVAKVRRTWASLPGAGYSQPEKSITALRAVYEDAGGTFA